MYKDGALLEKPILIAVNKNDRKYTDFAQKYEKLKRHVDYPTLPISAKEGTNLEVLLESIKETVDDEKTKQQLMKAIKEKEKENEMYK